MPQGLRRGVACGLGNEILTRSDWGFIKSAASN
jgi:hypothetical protein